MPDTIHEILNGGMPATAQIAALKEKSIRVPAWGGRFGLEREYDPRKHPVMNKSRYPDRIESNGALTSVTRVALGLQRLAVKRMTELICGIPVKRVYSPENDKQKEVAKYIEKILDRNRIDSLNIERCNMLYAGCEVMTLWYAIEDKNNIYGFDSQLKIRCRNFTPMVGDELYPLFDEYGDMIAMSVGYNRRVGKRTVSFFDAYTADRHIKWSNEASSDWEVVEDEQISIKKIPAIYMYRPTPIWEDNSNIVYEQEWSISRNGNYLRENSKPRFVVFADEIIKYGDEGSPEEEDKAVMQYPKGSSASYVTWQQATESLKYQNDTLRNLFFTLLQLPDWSYEKMSQQALSGESRKQLFIDAQLKVKDEGGRLLEFFDREINVIKAFLKAILPENMHKEIDALPVKSVITPFAITDEKDTITNLMAANGGKAIMSQRESIEAYGQSEDVEQTLREIQEQDAIDAFEPTL